MRTMTILGGLVLLACGCGSDGGDQPRELGAGSDLVTSKSDVSTSRSEAGGGDRGKSNEAQTSPGQPGSICTQQNQTCAAGLKCVFLEVWNAPKGTCMRVASGGCSGWDDPRCVVAGSKYSVMCGPYTAGGVTTDICFLLCKFNTQPYDCPPLHSCKTVNGFETCLPQ